MTPQQFVEKYQDADLPEVGVSQEHFADLCRLLGLPTPVEADPSGEDFAFEKHTVPTAAASRGSKGHGGYVDVFKRGCFIWEYKRKGKHKTLTDAYRQAVQYRDALDAPPLTVVCDIERIEIRTHFTGYPQVRHEVTLDEVPDRLNLLRRLFEKPNSFRPSKTTETITVTLAKEFGDVAANLIHGDHSKEDLFTNVDTGLRYGTGTAHFLMKVIFCLFAEDTRLLPKKLFSRIIADAIQSPDAFPRKARELFDKMATGGDWGPETIAHFNGGLFRGSDDAVLLNQAELRKLKRVADLDWRGVNPSIFGTLFERLLDPAKRGEIGAHYTSESDIGLVVDPVLMAPLRRAWETLKDAHAADAVQAAAEDDEKKRRVLGGAVVAAVEDFRQRLASVTVLDPACGSGNFLYVCLRKLLDLDAEAVNWAAAHGLTLPPRPHVTPRQLHGIEKNPEAVELAQVSVWIGYLQWLADRGIDHPTSPILQTLDTIQCRDAVLAWDRVPNGDPTARAWADLPKAKQKPGWFRDLYATADGDLLRPHAPDWPEADVIVGNPPFLGSKQFRRSGLDERTLAGLYHGYPDLPNTVDLCCYWFELARRAVQRRPATRVGLLATQAIRGGDNRTALERIKETATITHAHSDQPWTLDGAAVRTSIVGFTGKPDKGEDIQLDGRSVDVINANLTSGADVSRARRLKENKGIAFMGDTKGGPFDLLIDEALELLAAPNPNGKPTSDVVRPWVNGSDVTKRPRGLWIVDFGIERTKADAADYESAFGLTEQRVQEARRSTRQKRESETWWLHVRARPLMRAKLPRDRYIVTPNLTKHRLFTYFDAAALPDHQLIAFARDDDYFFGVLHSAVHEVWALSMGTQLESRPRYTPTSCFETFALPWVPGEEPGAGKAGHELLEAVAAAARGLDERRERWLNPPEWVAEVEAKVDRDVDLSAVADADARRRLRNSAVAAYSARDARLKKRTLTNLYNDRPAWLDAAHRALDEAVLACYARTTPGCPPSTPPTCPPPPTPPPAPRPRPPCSRPCWT